MTTPEQKASNRRMGLTLASIALLFLVGFIVRMVWIGH
ncbi:cytochrome oxidase small assembly protein [Variovorax sp. J22P168]|nr:cytochrome oxidase small assembly protein [Variovorax sp. J22P168]MDM0012399.1 cytochrome oxidase small assembly protein [Variovorax sp. J22P168]